MIKNYKKYPELYDEEFLKSTEDMRFLLKRQMKYTQFFQKLGESCITRSIMGAVGGAGVGIFFGMLTSSLPSTQHNMIMSPQSSTEVFKTMLTGMGRRSYGMAKTFAGFSFWFGGCECLLSKIRGRNDKINNLITGCAIGFGYGVRGGVIAGATGCAGFALFGLVMDFVLFFLNLKFFRFSIANVNIVLFGVKFFVYNIIHPIWKCNK